MPPPDLSPEQLLSVAVEAARQPPARLAETLDRLSAPVYLTDAEGRITYYNPACVTFAGRTPELGLDRWCVSWKLYTDAGDPLPHDQCPMAVAVRERRTVRGRGAVAERPDGTRVDFIAYPTPVHDDEGNFLGAVNLLVDVTARKQAQALRAQAGRCRELARSITDRRTAATLELMADEYEQMAADAEQA